MHYPLKLDNPFKACLLGSVTILVVQNHDSNDDDYDRPVATRKNVHHDIVLARTWDQKSTHTSHIKVP
jgi:hypothetical protein